MNDPSDDVYVQGRQRHDTTIHLASWSPDWARMYEGEARRIRTALRDRVRLLEHVGSTAVPGLSAKPKIDIVLVVDDPADEPSYVPDLESQGYLLHVREPDWHQHRLLRGTDREVNLHVFGPGCPEVARMLAFRDWLRAHPEDLDRYERAKRDLATRTWAYVQDYADAKSQVVEEILAKARRE